MEPEACRESFGQAAAFFDTFDTARVPVAIACRSWIFSPILEQILPSESNLVALTREVYLLPTAGGKQEGLWHLFNQEPIDPRTAPRATRVQRAVADFLAAGGVWRIGEMILMLRDLPAFGRGLYRAQSWRV
jgi:hypothetical protein